MPRAWAPMRWPWGRCGSMTCLHADSGLGIGRCRTMIGVTARHERVKGRSPTSDGDLFRHIDRTRRSTGDWTRGGPPVLAIVGELEVDVEVLALEQGDDALQIVALLRAHSQLIALDLRLDALGPLVADDLRDLLRIVLVDAFLEGGIDAVLLAGGIGLAVLERLQRDSALDQLRLEHVEDGLDPVFAVGL